MGEQYRSAVTVSANSNPNEKTYKAQICTDGAFKLCPFICCGGERLVTTSCLIDGAIRIGRWMHYMLYLPDGIGQWWQFAPGIVGCICQATPHCGPPCNIILHLPPTRYILALMAVAGGPLAVGEHYSSIRFGIGPPFRTTPSWIGLG